MNRKARNN